MSENPLKRARVDVVDLAVDAPSPAELQTQIAALTREEMAQILLQLAPAHPAIAAAIGGAVAAKQRAEAQRVHDFDHYSKSAWYQLNKAHDRKSGSKQYEAGYDVASAIRDMFADMAAQTHAHSPAATKQSALETMRKIAKSVCLANSEVGSVVRKNFKGGDEMIKVARCFSEEEVGVIEDDGLLQRLEELEALAKGYCIFEELGEVLDILTGQDGTEEVD